MSFTVVATWRAKPGEEGHIREVLSAMTTLSRAETGCIHYQAHVSATDPAEFMLYEQYVDSRAYDAHKSSDHFQAIVVNDALDHLTERTVRTFETIDWS
ncbi:putative quinol monooxygenase [Microbacterium lacus]|uniref:ABM domain-containing protein n=1 Tax=Microbacterium lacus TaxID=415217 RepID=A0ABN2H1I5_9MICO